ncbi:MAG: hypothetical protein ACR2QH_00865 [Geminicoccaceae bacterium]
MIADQRDAGGWRMFMREVTKPVDAVEPVRVSETIAALPGTVLGL